MFIYLYLFESSTDKKNNYLRFGLSKRTVKKGIRKLEKKNLINVNSTFVYFDSSNKSNKVLKSLFLNIKIKTENFRWMDRPDIKGSKYLLHDDAMDIITETIFALKDEGYKNIKGFRFHKKRCFDCNKKQYDMWEI